MNEATEVHHDSNEIFVGCMVEVVARTWPGINKIGGVARVTKCHYSITFPEGLHQHSGLDSKHGLVDRIEFPYETPETQGEGDILSKKVRPRLTHVDVRYVVMGGRERRVSIEYCRRAPQFETDASNHVHNDGQIAKEDKVIQNAQKRVHLRDRSLMLGRCKKCGSLRLDCGSCDWVEDHQQDLILMTRPKVKAKKRGSHQRDDELSDFSTSPLENPSDSSSSADDLFQRVHEAYSKLKAQKRKERRAELRTLSHRRKYTSSLELLGAAENQSLNKRCHGSQRNIFQTQSSSDEDSLFRNVPNFGNKVSNRLDNSGDRNLESNESIMNTLSSSDDSSIFITTLSGAMKPYRGVGQVRSKKLGHMDGALISTINNVENGMKESRRIGIVRDCDIGDTDDEERVNRHIVATDVNLSSRSINEEDEYSFDSTLWDDLSDWSEYWDDGFIQPEGEAVANNLPRDIVDQTETLSYEELVQFFYSKTNELRGITLPKAHERLNYFQLKLNGSNDTDVKVMSIMQSSYEECFHSYEDICKSLVEDGIDQCRLALKKILKRHKSEHVIILSNRDIDNMDCEFDALQSEIDEALRKHRLCLASFQNLIDDDDAKSLQLKEDLDMTTVIGVKKPRESIRTDENIGSHPFATRKRLRRQMQEEQALPNRRARKVRRRRRKSDKILDIESCNFPCESRAKQLGDRQARGRGTGTEVRGSNTLENAVSNKGQKDNEIHSVHGNISKNQNGLEVLSQRIMIPEDHARNEEPKNAQSAKRSENNRHELKPGFRKVHTETDSAMNIRSNVQLFEMLKDRSHVDDKASLSLDLLTIDINEICEKLTNDFLVTSVRNNILPMLPVYFLEMQRQCQSTKSYSKLVLNTLFNLILNHGTSSFVEMIACRDETIIPCVQLFTCLFNLTAINLQRDLEESDGIVFRMIKIKKQETIETILLLLIDVLYSILLPYEWGDPQPIKPALFQEFSSLSIALGKNLPIVETVARLLMGRFGCQCWYQVSRGNNFVAFVSSMNSPSLSLFWSDQGDAMASGSNIRWELLSSCLARKEIDALWTLLNFFSKFESGLEASSSFRWKLIMTMFETPAGVLGSTLPSKHCFYDPPSDTHVKACIREIRHLCTLLSNGALDPLQADNAVVIKIFLSCVFLEHTRVMCSEHIGSRTVKIERIIQKSVECMWRESDVIRCLSTSFAEDQLALAIEELSTFYYGDRPNGMFSLASDSVLLRAALHFVKLWIERHPDKRARWLRLNDSIQLMLNGCEEIGSAIPPSRSDDYNKFQKLFDNQNCFHTEGDTDASVNDEGVRLYRDGLTHVNKEAAGSFLREAAASLLICVALSRYERTSSSLTQNILPLVAKLDMSFCKQIWSLLVNKELESARESFSSQVGGEIVMNLSIQGHEVSSASKSITALIFLFLKKPAKELDIIIFLSTCLLTCFATASNSIATISRTIGDYTPTISMYAEILFRTSFWLNVLITILAKDYTVSRNSQSKKCIVMILSVIKKVIMNMLQARNPGKLIDSAFRCCLSAIRSSTSILSGASQPLSSSRDLREDRLTDANDDDQLLHRGAYSDGSNVANRISMDNKSILDCDSDVATFIRNLYQVLLVFLANSTPSTRFSLHSTVYPSDPVSNFSPLGREIVARHAGGVAATLAAVINSLGTEANAFILSAEFSLPQTICSINSSKLSKEDNVYFKRIGHVFIAEICRLAYHHETCLRIISRNYLSVVESFLNAVVDADILACFPTTDLAALLVVGDENCAIQEKERRQCILDSNNKTNDGLFKYDTEAVGIKKGYGDIFDSPGPSRMSKRIWSFGADIGHAFTRFETQLELLSAALLQPAIDARNTTLDSVDVLPCSSLERECIRRSMKLRAILKALSMEHGLLFTDIGKRLLSTMVGQLDSVIAAVSYLRRSEEETKTYDIAKALLLHYEYGLLCLDIFSWVLIRSRFIEGPSINLSEWLWEHVISIVAKQSDQRLNIFFLFNDLRNIDTLGLQSPSPAVQHYLDSLIFYIGSSCDQQFIYRNTHIVLDSSLFHLQVGEISSLCLVNVNAANNIASSTEWNRFSDCMIRRDLMMRKEELSGYEERYKSAGIRFRLQSFRHFLSKVKLSPSIPNDDREKIFSVIGDIIYKNLEDDMSIDANRPGFLQICELISVLNSLIVQALLQHLDDLIDLIFRTSIIVIKMRTKSGTPFLELMRSLMPSKVAACYVVISFEWLQCTAVFVADHYNMDNLSPFLNHIEGIVNNDEKQCELSCDMDMIRRWTLLYNKKKSLEMTLDIGSCNRPILSSSKKNPYTKLSKVTSTEHKDLKGKFLSSARLFLNEYAPSE